MLPWLVWNPEISLPQAVHHHTHHKLDSCHSVFEIYGWWLFWHTFMREKSGYAIKHMYRHAYIQGHITQTRLPWDSYADQAGQIWNAFEPESFATSPVS